MVSVYNETISLVYNTECAKQHGWRGFVGCVSSVDTWVRGWRGSNLTWVIWVAWVHKILVQIKKRREVKFCCQLKKYFYLIILYRNHCFYEILINCTNRIQQALQLFFVILNLFYITDLYVMHFQIYFQICPSSFFSKFGYLFCLICETMKITVNEQKERKAK